MIKYSKARCSMRRYGLRAPAAYLLAGLGVSLPTGRFFAIRSAVAAGLAVALISKGTAALQEAEMLDIKPIAGSNTDLLGIYPSIQTVVAQLAVLLLIAGSMYLSLRAHKKAVVRFSESALAPFLASTWFVT
jgi:high-affinity iron transporter